MTNDSKMTYNIVSQTSLLRIYLFVHVLLHCLGHLVARELRATPDTKAHPGIMTIAVNSTDYHLIRCRNYASAYSAAWLSPIDYVLKAAYNDRATLEWHSHNLYHAAQAGAYKLEAPNEYGFFVNHMSAYEHGLAGHRKELSSDMEASVEKMSEAEELRSCPNKQGHGKTFHQIIGVVPFYPGAVGNDNVTGNAHSISSSSAKAHWLKSVTCSLTKYMSTVLIGTCNEAHRTLALDAIDQANVDHATVDVINFHCEKTPVHLPYILLRHVQHHLTREGSKPSHHSSTNKYWTNAQFVYFTEMDNALYVESDLLFDALVEFIGPVGYVSPNRMNKKASSRPSDLSRTSFKISGQNVCART